MPGRGLTRSRYHRAAQADPDFRRTYEAVRRKIRQSVDEGQPVYCGICRRRIFRRYQHPSPYALQVDHIRPLNVDDPATMDAANMQPTHAGCNRRKGRRDTGRPVPEPAPTFTSRW